MTIRSLWVICVVFGIVIETIAGSDLDALPEGVKRLGSISFRNRQGVNGVGFSPDGKRLASVGWGDSIRIWDVESGQQLQRIQPAGMSFAAVYSPDGTKLASIGSSQVRLYDLQANKLVFESQLQSERITGIAFAPDGLTFATAGSKEEIILWDVETGDDLLHLHTVEGGQDVHPLAFSPNGDQLASCDKRGTIRVWNLKTGAYQSWQSKGKRSAKSLAFVDEGKLVANSNLFDRNQRRMVAGIYVYNVNDGSELGKFSDPKLDSNADLPFVLTSDRSRLVSLTQNQIVVWDVATRKVINVIPRRQTQSYQRTHGVAISPDGRILATDAGTHKVYLHDLETGKELHPDRNSHHGGVLSIAVSNNDQLVASGGEEGSVQLWNAKSLQHQRSFSVSNNWIRAVNFFPDRERILAVGEFNNPKKQGFEGVAFIVRISDGKVLRRIELPDRGMQAVLSKDGKRMMVALGLGMDFGMGERNSQAPKLGIWDLTTDTKPTLFDTKNGEAKQIMLDESANQCWIVGSQMTSLWDLKTGKQVSKKRFEPTPGYSPRRLTPSGKELLFGQDVYSRRRQDSKGFLKCLNLGSSDPHWSHEFVQARVSDIAISDDGRLYAAYVRSNQFENRKPNRLILGRAASGQILQQFEIDDGNARSLRFSHDGKRLYSGMDRGDILVWDVANVVTNN